MLYKVRIESIKTKLFSLLPIRLSWGSLWLVWADTLDEHIDNFEKGEQNFLLKFLKPGMTFLDIGAHHGLYTLLASRKVGKQGVVIAFEPSPREIKKLKRHLIINRCHNVLVEPVALGSINGAGELFICFGKETALNSLRQPEASGPFKKIQVSVKTLDSFLQKAKIDNVNFMKIDVEGAEREVIKGARRTLDGFKPLVMCELSDNRSEPWGYRSVEIYELIAAHGYKWFSITPEGLLRSCPKKEKFHENLIAVYKEKLNLVSAFMEGCSE